MLLRYNLILIGWKNSVVVPFFFSLSPTSRFENIRLSAMLATLAVTRGLLSKRPLAIVFAKNSVAFSGDDIYGLKYSEASALPIPGGDGHL